MAKRTKTFKIGEYCVGGIISVEITGKVLTIINKEWDTSTGYTKRSNQSNAKELSRATGMINEFNWERKASDYLHELTTSYYADKIMDWIKGK